MKLGSRRWALACPTQWNVSLVEPVLLYARLTHCGLARVLFVGSVRSFPLSSLKGAELWQMELVHTATEPGNRRLLEPRRFPAPGAAVRGGAATAVGRAKLAL